MLQILIFAECLIFTRVFNGWLYMEVDQKSDYNKNVFLIGLMGAGKTSVGRMLSRVLEKEFYDSDLVIEEKTGVKITDIFDIEGEAGFRKRECGVINQLTGMSGIVLATGGGVILNAGNRENLKTKGTVIYLHAEVSELYKRTKHDLRRPLLDTDDVKGRLCQLYQVRDPLYRAIADLVFETKSQGISELAEDIIATLRSKSSAGSRGLKK